MKTTLHLTQSCNMQCTYCYAGEQSDTNMSQQTAEQAVDFLFAEAEKQEDDYLSITFFGGEPLLRADLIAHLVDYTKKSNKNDLKVRYAINTNGTILTESIANLLRDNLFHLFFSIDGGRVAQDKHRLFPGEESSFFVVEQNLPTFLKINPYLVTISVITPETVPSLVQNVEYLTDVGIRLMMLAPDYTADWDEKSFVQLTKAYKKLGEHYVSMHRRKKKAFINLFDDRINTHIHEGKPRQSCNLADSEFSIAPDGTIFPCVQFINSESVRSKKFAVGHVAEGWNEAVRQQVIAQSKETPTLCQDCALLGRCRNYCGCVNYRTTGKINDVAPFSCTHERMLFPIVDSVGNKLFKEKNALFLEKFYNPYFSLLSVLEEEAL